MDEIIVHSYDWKTSTDPETGYTTINCWALDKNSTPHLLRIHEFDAFCYVELPLFLNNSFVSWTQYRQNIVYEAICNILGEDRPYRYRFEMKEKIYFYKGKNKKYPMFLMCFHSISSMQSCKNKLKKAFKVWGLRGGEKKNDETMIALRVWETHIPLERKMLTLRNCKYCQWFNIKGVKVQGTDKISTLEHEYVVDWKTLNPIPLEDTVSWITNPGILSFDLETYSDRHNAMPDSLCSKHVIYLVSVVYQKFLKPETRKKEIVLFGDCSDTDLANVIKVKTEMELIDTLQALILKYNPEIISGYNIMQYDFGYLENRLKRRMKEWKPLGRLIGEPSTMSTISWSSSAYKNQDFSILEMSGRICIDLLPLVKRDYKLPLYKLDYVAKYFLGKGKYDVTAQQMFEIYELQKYLSDNYVYKPEEDLPKSFYKNYKKVNNIEVKDGNEDAELKEKMKNEWQKTYKTFALDEMKKVVDYCVVDSDLVVDLFDKINVWIGIVQLSNIMGVVPADIFTRGTGVRMQSQVYDEASRSGIVLDEYDFPKADIEGGFVFDPVPGIYYNIPTFDFKSLYPNCQIAHNIDHTSMLNPQQMDLVPDEECHVIEWDDEIDENESDSEDEMENEEREKKVKKKKTIHRKYKFVKEPLGIMPRLLINLINERNKVRGKQKYVAKGSLEWTVLEQTQLGIKASTNAFYGACASSFSKLRLPEGAECITAKARESTKKMNAYLESKGHRVIYGDTDSTMPDVGIKDPKDAKRIGHALAKELSALYPKPMEIEFECTYATMLCIKKKMYICILLDDEGNAIEDPDAMKIRGVTLARRDNCKFQRDFYKSVVWKILHDHEKFLNVFNFIVDKCLELLQRKVPWEDLTMIKGLGSNYKSATYMMNIFAQEMQKSGNPLVPGDRITYLLVKTTDDLKDETKTGFKMRTPELYNERAESENPEHIDYLYYLEKTIKNGVERQLYQVGYKKELDEIEKKYIEMDQNRFFQELGKKIISLDGNNSEIQKMRIQGYQHLLNTLFAKFEGDKGKVIEHLLEDESFVKIAKPLYNYIIKRRRGRGRRLSTRIDREPITMMVRIARAKMEYCKSIRDGDYQLTPIKKPKKLILKIMK